MKSLTKLTFVIIMICGIIFSSVFDENDAYSQSIQGGLNLLIGVPQGDFKENIGTSKVGGSIWAGYKLKNSPVSFGLELDYFMYGKTKRTELFNNNIPEVNVDVSTTYNILSALSFLRFSSKRGNVIPYFDCLVGFNYLYTRTSVSDDEDYFESIAATTNYDDTSLSYGFGLGCMLKIFDIQNKKNENNPFQVFLNFRFQYLLGNEADYLRKGSLTTAGQRVIYDLSRSRTDMLTIQIGANVIFDIR
ncbi:outer membrane beta-barrel protein [candidate division KSB1 bacterium]